MVCVECDIRGVAPKDYRFSRKQIRDATGWGNTQLKVHCHRLEEMEYLLVHRGKRGQSFEYELLYEAPNDKSDKQLIGLIDVESLKKQDCDANKSGLTRKESGSSRPQVGRVSESIKPLKANTTQAYRQNSRVNAENAHRAV